MKIDKTRINKIIESSKKIKDYYVDLDDFDEYDDSKYDKLEQQNLYMIAHPGAESTPYD